MKIILSCNDNPNYRDYWPVVRWQWKYLGYEPFLFYVTNNNVFENDPLVQQIEPLEDQSEEFFVKQSQIARIYGCLFFPDDICITSDIDCFLLQKDYLRNKWHQHNPDGKHMLAYSHGYYKSARRVGMQFIGGVGANWKKVLGCETSIPSWKEFIDKFPTPEYDKRSSDEITLGNMLYDCMDVRTIYLPRENEPEWRHKGRVRRFSDRIYRQYKMEYDEEKLKNGEYIDITSGRFYPWMSNVREIWNKVYDDPLPDIAYL